MTKAELFLKEISFFKTLSMKEISFLSGYLEMESFAPGQTILKQGNEGSSLYLIKTGVVSVLVQLPGDTLKEVTKLQEGKLFGEVSFLGKTLITANIVADVPCECLVFSRSVLEMLRVGFPETAFKIERLIALQSIDRIISNIHNINKIVQSIPAKLQDHTEHAHHLPNSQARYEELILSSLDTSYIANLSLSKMLAASQIATLLPYLSIRSYDRGYLLTSNSGKDSASLRLAWIYSGAVMLFIKKDNELKTSIAVNGVGELLIENFLFPDFRQIAEYVTCEKSILLELDFDAYKSLEKVHPSIFFIVNQHLHNAVVRSLYTVNREFVRIHSEYRAILR